MSLNYCDIFSEYDFQGFILETGFLLKRCIKTTIRNIVQTKILAISYILKIVFII